ncbi:MAG: hypothetical protein LBG15_09315 [Dysgonamonadaceae bacterium]|jgi:hypothetical protein|nr:hypothetical protein [Dysgonamonadaceae bacterium]
MTGKKRNIKKARAICDLYATDKHTIESCCESEGVPYATFYCWVTPCRKGYVQDIQELYKKACEERQENRKRSIEERKLSIGEKALVALEKKIEGWTWQETTQENGKATKIVDKFQVPDTASIIFSLTNAFEDDFKNRQNTDITTKGKPIVDKIEIEIVKQKNTEHGNT